MTAKIEFEIETAFENCDICSFLELDKETLYKYNSPFFSTYRCVHSDICENAADIYMKGKKKNDSH